MIGNYNNNCLRDKILSQNKSINGSFFISHFIQLSFKQNAHDSSCHVRYINLFLKKFLKKY